MSVILIVKNKEELNVDPGHAHRWTGSLQYTGRRSAKRRKNGVIKWDVKPGKCNRSIKNENWINTNNWFIPVKWYQEIVHTAAIVTKTVILFISLPGILCLFGRIMEEVMDN